MCCPIPAVAILSNIGALLMQFLTDRPFFFCNLECTVLGNASGLGRYCCYLFYKIKGEA